MPLSQPDSEPRILTPGSTFYRDTCAVESPSLSSMPGSQEPLPQPVHRMIARVTDELKNATYRVDLTAQGSILHADVNTVKAVIDCLESRHNLTHETLKLPPGTANPKSRSSAINPRLPSDGYKDENDSYEPLVHLLNKVIDAADQCTSLAASYLSGLRFHHFGREVEERYGSAKGIVPDGVGIIGTLPTGTKGLPWENVKVIVESKRTVTQIVQQSGMYTGFCLLNDQKRFFALGIGLHFTTLDAYVFVFHRSGLSSSRPLKLTTEEGFRGFVRHIVGILSFQGEADYGLDTTRSQNMFCINNRYYEIVRPLYMRDSPWGRSTVVYSLNASTNEPPPFDLQSRMLTLSNGVTQIPDRLAYKQIYPIKGRSQEGPLFSKFIGKFGIADVIGYHICGPEEPHGSTGPFLVDADFWKLFEDQIDEDMDEQDLEGRPTPRRHEPEERGLQCIALSSEGQVLLDLHNKTGGTPSPGDLLESILHAIIGHYNLFDKGVLHRDVSLGNVLHYSDPVWRPALDNFECTRNVNYCRGFLIDGDHAIKWREHSRSRSISGTMPFMSMRLLCAWQVQKPIIHTALDDLESFLWLLIWVIVYASKDLEGARNANRGIQLMLDAWSGDVGANRSKRETAKFGWNDIVFGDLIQGWLEIFEQAHQENKRLTEGMSMTCLGSQGWDDACNELESHCKGIYGEVLESGFRHLEEIRKYSDWNKVVVANVCRFTRIRR